MGDATFVQPVFTSCHTFCTMSWPTFAQASVICVLSFSSVLDNRPIRTLTNFQKETFIGVSYGDVRPPRPKHWLGRSSCWKDCVSLWVCDYVHLHGKSYLEHLPALVALNNPLAVETNNSATLTSGVLSSGTSCVVWWLEDTIKQSNAVCWFNPSCCCVPAWRSFCCRLWWRW